ncbi:MAG: TonB-dependent receptor plug domain-containing protein [Bacteroides sp.]|nr:TonB-dependent receptor plug domain-containing protein [Bacteroides sp.]
MKKSLCLLSVMFFLGGGDLLAQTEDSLKHVLLDEVVVSNRVNHLNALVRMDLKVNPVNSSQEMLRMVPGLFIAQHAGGGKAEQMFLRGFDLDHGTDIHITVDGMPVNMTSHAHGQGYADLHFLQPETIEHIDFDKGPYHAEKGNLATAGYVAFKTKDRMENEVALEVGQFDTQRLRLVYSLLDDERRSLYVSTAFLQTSGYFDAPQDFNRLNLLAKYTAWGETSRFSLMLSHFQSDWDASGQIPLRAVRRGLISRFGALDDTEGGDTRRTNLNVTWLQTLDNGADVTARAWLSLYGFDLYSNFTFFLNDSVNGDQINQRENRLLAGGDVRYSRPMTWGESRWKWRGGVGFRYDRVDDLALYHTVNRRRIGTYSLGCVDESNLYGYADAEITWGKWLLNPALRLDYFRFGYADRLQEEYAHRETSKARLSPKLNVAWHPSPHWQWVLKMGMGFHSNDARVVVERQGREVLPAAYGVDLGVVWKPRSSLVLNASLWYLKMQQEFVYVGDEAVVEAGGRTRRYGVDLGVRWELLRDFYLQADYTYSHARSIDEPKGADRIPLAPVHTFVGGLNWRYKGWTANLRTRFLADRPANEDASLTAKGYCVTDLNASYTWRNLTAGLIVENLFDTAWREAQFATETRLPDEAEPVTEIHFTPGTPFNARCFVTLRF